MFVDVTDRAGIRFHHDHGGFGKKYIPEIMGSGVCVLDADGDGWMDLYFVQSGSIPGAGVPAARQHNALYRNLGNGEFEDVSAGSGADDAGYGMGCVAADYDGDGDTDLYILNLGANRLLRNLGDGRFEDVTDAAGVGDPRWGSSATFFDADGDGDLDLYVANYLEFSVDSHIECGNLDLDRASYCHPDVYPMAPDVFYRNDGSGVFTARTDDAHLTDTTGKGMGAVASDFDGDGHIDLYIANDSTPNFYCHNTGDGRFEDIALYAGVGYNDQGETEAGMGVDVGDVNGDLTLDIVVTNLSREANALYTSEGGGFLYATKTSGLYHASYLYTGFGTNLFDADNDGDLDLFVTNGHVIDNIELYDDVLSFRQPSQLFLNDGSGRFAEVGPDDLGSLSLPRVGRGSAVLDHDNDGDLDLAVVFNADRARLFQNTAGDERNWIGFELIGPPGNRPALGAQIVISVSGRRQVRELRAGASYQSSNDPRAQFGIDAAPGVESVHIRWPDGTKTEFGEMVGSRYHRIEWAPAAP